MAHSVITTTGSPGFGPYTLNFTLGILNRDYVTCRVNSEVDGLGDPVYRTLEWVSDSVVNITSGTEPTGSDTVVYTRTVPVDALVHDYSDDAIITEGNLDESNLQNIMLAHQFIDGRITSPFANDLNMGGYKITNLAAGTAASDAVRYDQISDLPAAIASAEAAQAAAESARDTAITNKDLAVAAASAAGTAQTAAETAQDLAERYATEDEDVIVEGSNYSAKHWAAKAEGFAADAADVTAAEVSYDNTTSLLTGTTVQAALDEIDGDLDTVETVIAGLGTAATANVEDFLNPRVQAVSAVSSVTPTNLNDMVVVTGQDQALTIANPTGTHVQGQALVVRITDDGTARALTWGTSYVNKVAELPATTTISKTLFVFLVYNTTTSKYDCISVGEEA